MNQLTSCLQENLIKYSEKEEKLTLEAIHRDTHIIGEPQM